MYKIFVAILIILTTSSLEAKQKQKTSPRETLKLLNEIKEDAIVFGKGRKEIHSFIDPKCSMSQRYLQFIFKKKRKLFKRYTIYLYLYELKRKNSGNMIRNIFDSDYPETLLKSIMVNNYIPFEEIEEELDDDDIEERVFRIEEVAEQIGVYKRPYIITNGRGK
jgi:hypothetical protein